MDIKIIEKDTNLEKLLQCDFLGRRSHYIEVGPEKIILPEKFERYYKKITDFRVRDDDVFVLAFPKSGSRWTQEMVWLLLNDLDFKKAHQVLLEARSPLLEFETIFDNDEHKELLFDSISELPSPRCIKSHLHWTLLPREIRLGEKQPKTIVVLRGPEDTCTSYYHHLTVVDKCSGKWDDFCELFLKEKVPYGPYWKHLFSLWEQKYRPNIMFITYSKMVIDLAGSIRDVADFLGKKLSEDDIKKMCQHLQFENLKKSKGFNLEPLLHIKNEDINPLARQGKVGDHKNAMSAEVIVEFKKQREQHLKGTGISFD